MSGNDYILGCLIACAISGPAVADEATAMRIVAQGNARGAAACVACHGEQGLGVEGTAYPYLAGLSARYIEDQLVAYRAGTRKHPVMSAMAATLADEEITVVAQYYSTLDNPGLKKSRVSASDELGEVLATDGKWMAGLPACFRCHGPEGRGIAPYFPPIVGQPAQYVKEQLNAWQDRSRHNDPVGLMQAVVQELSDEDIDALAHYLGDPDE